MCNLLFPDKVVELEQELSIYRIPQMEKMEATLVAPVASARPSTDRLHNHIDQTDSGISDDDNLKGR